MGSSAHRRSDACLARPRTVLRSFLTKSQFHGTSVYRQNETFVTLSSGGPVLWTSVRQLFKEIGAEIQCEGNVKAAMGGAAESTSPLCRPIQLL